MIFDMNILRVTVNGKDLKFDILFKGDLNTQDLICIKWPSAEHKYIVGTTYNGRRELHEYEDTGSDIAIPKVGYYIAGSDKHRSHGDCKLIFDIDSNIIKYQCEGCGQSGDSLNSYCKYAWNPLKEDIDFLRGGTGGEYPEMDDRMEEIADRILLVGDTYLEAVTRK